uniref:Uncharacterized protein n=1 Tax=Cannabis sativa TaxID=3483 RepID=A0A803PKY7_CANSA
MVVTSNHETPCPPYGGILNRRRVAHTTVVDHPGDTAKFVIRNPAITLPTFIRPRPPEVWEVPPNSSSGSNQEAIPLSAPGGPSISSPKRSFHRGSPMVGGARARGGFSSPRPTSHPRGPLPTLAVGKPRLPSRLDPRVADSGVVRPPSVG